MIDFYRLRNVSRERGTRELARAWARYNSIAIHITDLSFKDVTDKGATADFYKEWDFRGATSKPSETTSSLCKTFPAQTPAEQRRLLKILVERATWKGGELENHPPSTIPKTPSIEPSNHNKTQQ